MGGVNLVNLKVWLIWTLSNYSFHTMDKSWWVNAINKTIKRWQWTTLSRQEAKTLRAFVTQPFPIKDNERNTRLETQAHSKTPISSATF